jgi:hypothetical protein
MDSVKVAFSRPTHQRVTQAVGRLKFSRQIAKGDFLLKTIFTIHAGEYLVASYLENKYKKARVWLPSKDTGVDLLITDQQHNNATSLQVKFSKDFMGNTGVGKNASRHNVETLIKSGGWWTFNYDKIKNSPADLWVLVLYRFSYGDSDFVIIEPRKLLELYENLGKRSGTIQSYVWVTKSGRCWETRGLGKAEQDDIATDKFIGPVRDLTRFLNNWRPLEEKIGT